MKIGIPRAVELTMTVSRKMEATTGGGVLKLLRRIQHLFLPGQKMQIDINEISGIDTHYRSPEFKLWFRVFIDAFFTIRDGGDSQTHARRWIEEPNNIFFEAISYELGYSPEAFRERIRKALESANAATPGDATTEIGCRKGHK